MKSYNKIFKWAMVILIVVSVVLLVLGFTGGWKEGNVDTLLGWTYCMVGLALAAVVIVGLVVGAINDPKSLVKLGLGLVAVAAVCFIAYLIAPGAPAMGMLEQPSAATLKLTDTILYLTYFAGIVAVLSIVVGEIRLAITNKKG
jgi:phosphoglycerol transferase MdoB-like AlkP superfamily enzyme